MKLTENGKRYHATKTSKPKIGRVWLYQVSIDDKDAGLFWARNGGEAILRCIEENEDKLPFYPPLYLVRN